MDLKTLEKDRAGNVTHFRENLVADIKAEAVHIADPAECGNIVRRRFGLTITLLLFVAFFLGAAAFGIFLYTHR